MRSNRHEDPGEEKGVSLNTAIDEFMIMMICAICNSTDRVAPAAHNLQQNSLAVGESSSHDSTNRHKPQPALDLWAASLMHINIVPIAQSTVTIDQ